MTRFRKLSHEEISRNRLAPDAVNAAERTPIIVLLDNIRSMYNVGSIFRTADGAFLKELLLVGYTPTPEKNQVKKTALGASDTIPWRYFKDPVPVLQQLKESKVSIIALEHTTDSIPYYELPEDILPACIVVGNELTGISETVLEYADFSVDIPMYGTKQSLNVAVACGIVLFELVRRCRTG
jgi:tRNA G18 (ribose-2'-O)-methylase SpoU